MWGTGTTWGLSAPWGLPVSPGEAEFCEIADGRVLVQMDDNPSNRKFRDFLCDLVEGLGRYRDVSLDVESGFDLDTAEGAQLDAIGEVIGLQRQGFDDTRYRTFLKIQADLLLSAVRDDAEWTGTVENVIKICRTFIGAAPGQVQIRNVPPYAFTLDVPGVTLDEMKILASFLCRAIYAGVLGYVTFILASDSLWDSSAVGPIVDGGIWCSASVAVSPCATWNTLVIIGLGAC